MRRVALVLLCVAASLGGAAAPSAAVERITFTVRPTLIGSAGTAELLGSASRAGSAEEIRFEAKDCGQSVPVFREVAGTQTTAGGGFTYKMYVMISTTLRARWKNEISDEVEVKRRAIVFLRRISGGRFRVGVAGLVYFDGKRAVIERWDRRSARWLAVKRVVLKRLGSGPGSVASAADFRLRVAKGVLIRAVFPTAAARPCYVAGVSQIVRT